MWKLEELKHSYESYKSGKWESYDLAEVEMIVKYHASQVVINSETLTEKQKTKAINVINELTDYYDKRTKALDKPKTTDKNERKSPTEVYKQLFGKNPTDVFREKFGNFDKKEYAKWLTQAIKQAC